jgi:hypothetical protein
VFFAVDGSVAELFLRFATSFSIRQFPHCIRTLCPVPPFELLARTHRSNIGNPIYGENPIEMINFVLKQLRQVSIVAGA